MSDSPFSDLMEAIKKACLNEKICQAIESFRKVIAHLSARCEEIERQTAEALDREMATALAAGDTISFASLMDMIKEAQDMCKKEPDDTNELRDENMEWERPFWRSAAALARSRVAARAQAYAVQMMQQKARQAMQRRKLKHADGYFPDWEGGRRRRTC